MVGFFLRVVNKNIPLIQSPNNQRSIYRGSLRKQMPWYQELNEWISSYQAHMANGKNIL
jgi:hypothetical protein